MTSISKSSAHDAAAAGAQRAEDAQQRSAAAQNARSSAQFAVLYRGETAFTYSGSPQSGSSASSIRSKQMANALARKRRAEKKQQRNARRSGEDDGPERGGHHGERLRVTRDGKRGGQQGWHGGHDDEIDGPAAPSIKLRAGAVVPPPPEGRLDALAAKFGPGEEAARATAVRTAWESDMLALRRELAAHPQRPVSARVFEQSIALLRVQQRIGQLPPGSGVASLRERAGDGGDTGADAGVARLTRPDPMPPEHVQRFNILFGLLWLHSNLRLTQAHRARSIDSLNSQLNGVVSRAASVPATDPPPVAPARDATASTNTLPRQRPLPGPR